MQDANSLRGEACCGSASCLSVSAVRQEPQKPVRHAAGSAALPTCQKTFISPLTGQKASAYIPAIDAAADANGAKNFLRNRAVGPDFGREQGLFCGSSFLSPGSRGGLLFDIVERRREA